MGLLKLTINQFRNIDTLGLSFSPDINLLYGANGSGKTTILEAIHVLALGRSFRTNQLNHAIQHDADYATVTGIVHPEGAQHELTLQMQKQRSKKTAFKIGQQPAASIAELATHLPVQMLNFDSYQLLGSAPELRRRFIDWMVFHVEPSFFKIWQDYHKILKQRNAVLKGYGGRDQLGYWTEKLAELGENLHDFREKTLNEWEKTSIETLNKSPGIENLGFEYDCGWDSSESFKEQLNQRFQQDLELGYTSIGPHRADLKITVNNNLARHVLSTGQQKTFVSLLQLTQCSWVSRETSKKPIVLVDDLPSELDISARGKLGEYLLGMDMQVFLTGVEETSFSAVLQEKTHKMFHVKHGSLQEVV